MQTQTRILLAIIFAILVFVLWREQSSAQAKPEKPVPTGRFQIAAWGGASVANGGLKVAHGAYIVDTQTGHVYEVSGVENPTRIGRVQSE